MNVEETGQLLVRISTYDNRQVEKSTIMGWQEVLEDIGYGDAERAVIEHFRTSTDYLMPRHIVAAAMRYSEERAVRDQKERERGLTGEAVPKPPYYDAMLAASTAAVAASISRGHTRGDDITVQSARGAARVVREEWEAEHGTWTSRWRGYDDAQEPF